MATVNATRNTFNAYTDLDGPGTKVDTNGMFAVGTFAITIEQHPTETTKYGYNSGMTGDAYGSIVQDPNFPFTVERLRIMNLTSSGVANNDIELLLSDGSNIVCSVSEVSLEEAGSIGSIGTIIRTLANTSANNVPDGGLVCRDDNNLFTNVIVNNVGSTISVTLRIRNVNNNASC